MLSGSGGIGGGGGVQWSKPAALVCHICGREYGTSSLKIHIPQCEKMWIEREKLKPRAERRPVPKAASHMGTGAKLDLRNPDAMAAYNEAATKQFNERALVPCPNCSRTFFEDRLAIHMRSCRPGNEAARVGTGRIKSASESVAAATPLKARGPGQTYGAGQIPSMAAAAPSAASPSSAYSAASPTSPASSAAPKRASLSSATGSRPRGAGAPGVTFADQQSPSNQNGGGKTPRPAATPARPSGGGAGAGAGGGRSAPAHQPPGGGSWEDDLNDELDQEASSPSNHRAPPAKSYSMPADDGGGGGDDGDGGNLVPCSLCGRHFNEDRVAKHEGVCRKQQVSNAKRAAKIAAKQAKMPQHATGPPKPSVAPEAWKSKHNEFQQAIQYAKKLTVMQKQGISLANLPPPPRSENPDYITCPYCTRRFNQQAGERHIAACKNTVNKPKGVNKPTKAPAAGSMAAQRQQQQQQQQQQQMQGMRGAGTGPVRAMPGYGAGSGAGGYGGQAGAYGGVGGYSDEYGYQQQTSPQHQRAPSGNGLQPRLSGGGGVAGLPPGRPGSQLSSPSSAASSAQKRAPSPARPGPAVARVAPQQMQPQGYGIGSPTGRNGAGAGSDDLHAKINQLTETVQMLSKAVLSPGAASSRSAAPSARVLPNVRGSGGGSSCRSCGQANPVAAAKFCPHCGTRS